VPKGDWGNLYTVPLVKLSWCHDLLLMRITLPFLLVF
jgi:hypothetical protein